MSGGASKPDQHLRPKPDDFEVVFTERGRLECESYFRAGRNTITRWLKESGKARLLKLRRAYVKAHRDYEVQERHRRKAQAKDQAEKEQRAHIEAEIIDPQVLALAARYLQMKQNGSWVVYELECGLWMIGTRRRTPGELLDKAKGKGFDVARAMRQIQAFKAAE